MSPNDADGMANSVGAVWSGSALFAKAYLSENLGSLRYSKIRRMLFYHSALCPKEAVGMTNEPRHEKTNKMSVRPAKTQISLGIRPVWSESSLCTQWVAKDPSFLPADSEDWSDWADTQADQSLRWAHTHFVGFLMSRLK